MNSNLEQDNLEGKFRDLLRHVHTIKPAYVIATDGKTVDLKPQTCNRYLDGYQLPTPPIYKLPFMVYSANMGKARITVPIKQGDRMLVLYSDRAFGNLHNELKDGPEASEHIQPLNGYPFLAIPCWLPKPSQEEIDPDKIIIENGTARISLDEDGDISVFSDSTVEVQAQDVNVDTVRASVSASESISAKTSTLVSTSDTASLTASQSLSVTAPQMTFTGNSSFVGNVSIAGLLGVTGIATLGGLVAGALGGAAQIMGDLIISGKSFLSHFHNDNEGDPTTPPVG